MEPEPTCFPALEIPNSSTNGNHLPHAKAISHLNHCTTNTGNFSSQKWHAYDNFWSTKRGPQPNENCLPIKRNEFPTWRFDWGQERRQKQDCRCNDTMCENIKLKKATPDIYSKSEECKLPETTYRSFRFSQVIPKTIFQELESTRHESEIFVQNWENIAMPSIENLLDTLAIRPRSVAVYRDIGKPDTRVVEIMSQFSDQGLVQQIKREVKERLASLPSPEIYSGMKIVVNKGEIVRSTTDDSDSVSGRNSQHHSNILPGDSFSVVGCNPHTATLGPVFTRKYEGKVESYWLTNSHPLGNQANNLPRLGRTESSGVLAIHPGYLDRNQPDTEGPILGSVVAHSGEAYKTISSSISNPGKMVTTDWALFKTTYGKTVKPPEANQIRCAPPGIGTWQYSPAITTISAEFPRRSIVYSTGRTSGFSFALTCETPAHVTQHDGTTTVEWFVECLQQSEPTAAIERWKREGMGVPGDSGAPIIVLKDHSLLGHVWGRNCYGPIHSKMPRITYFTHIRDVLHDIGEKYPDLSILQLPQGMPLQGLFPEEEIENPTKIEHLEVPKTDGHSNLGVQLDSQSSHRSSTSERPGANCESNNSRENNVPSEIPGELDRTGQTWLKELGPKMSRVSKYFAKTVSPPSRSQIQVRSNTLCSSPAMRGSSLGSGLFGFKTWPIVRVGVR